MSAIGGHLGVGKMLHALKARVFWPAMRKSVAAFVAGCDGCQRTKDSTRLPPGLL